MKLMISILFLCYTLPGTAQFSYFSNFYEPPGFENNNGSALWNLFVLDTNLWCAGAAFADSTYGHLILNVDDETGYVLSEHFIPYDNIVPFYARGDTYELSPDSNFIGTHEVYQTQYDSTAVFTFELSKEGTVVWQNVNFENVNDSTAVSSFLIRQLNNGSKLTCGVVTHLETGFDPFAGILLTRLNSSNEFLEGIEIPVWNEAWQDSIEHFNVFPTDMMELSDSSILIAGVWGVPLPTRRIPFFVKLDANLQPLSHFQFGNSNIDNWHPWLYERDDGNVLFAYGHGVQWDENISTYAIRDMRIGLFDPTVMDTLWVNSYPHQGVIQRLQDFEPTPDGGYITLAQGTNLEEEVLEAYLLKVDSNFEEEWFQTYNAPVYTWDLTMHDLEVTEDGG